MKTSLTQVAGSVRLRGVQLAAALGMIIALLVLSPGVTEARTLADKTSDTSTIPRASMVVGQELVLPAKGNVSFDTGTGLMSDNPAITTASTSRAAQCPPTIRRGSRGRWVAQLQLALFKARYLGRIDIDGIFGPRTRSAVMDFQRYHRLRIDGIVGPKTWHALRYC